MDNDDNFRPNIDRRSRSSPPNNAVKTSNQSSYNKSQSTSSNSLAPNNSAYNGSNSSTQPNSLSNQNNKGNNRRHFGWIICIISLIVLILLIVLFKSCNNSQKSPQGYIDSDSTNNSSFDYSESDDSVSSVSKEISSDSVDESVIGKVRNYLKTNSLQTLVDLYNTSIINHEGYEKVDSLIIEKINQIEDNYLNGKESYEDSTTDLKTLSGLSSDYLSGYAKKKLNAIEVEERKSSAVTSSNLSSVQETSNVSELSDNMFSEVESSVIEQSSDNDVQPVRGKTVVVDPIPEKGINIKQIPSNKTSINNTSTKTISGNISSDKQNLDFPFKSVNNGLYRFEFSEVNDGVYYDLEILNTAYEIIKSSGNLNTGDGISVSLDSNKDYIIRVSQRKNHGPFKLIIGIKQPIVDISTYTSVSDDIQFTDQRNTYSFVPSNDGLHRFEYDDVPDGMYLNMVIYNSGWETIRSGGNMSSGDGLSVKLTKGKLYYIKSEYYSGYGRYSLMIGHKKDSVKLSDYTTVYDSIQYTDQKNEYYFVPSVEGTHRFEFSDVPDGMYLEMEVFNSGWETIRSGSNMSTYDGLTVKLEKDKQYIIQVRQYRNYGSYSISVGYKKSAVNVSNDTFVSDSIQYTDQKNEYYFVPSNNSSYRIEFSDVPDGMYLEMDVCNSGWETIKGGSNMGAGDGLTVSLKKDKQYIIQVRQQKDIGTYSFKLCQE